MGTVREVSTYGPRDDDYLPITDLLSLPLSLAVCVSLSPEFLMLLILS